MDFPPRKRVDGARALARAFVLSTETITRIKHLSMPRYGKLGRDDLYNRIAQIHRLCMYYELELREGNDGQVQDTKEDG